MAYNEETYGVNNCLSGYDEHVRDEATLWDYQSEAGFGDPDPAPYEAQFETEVKSK